MNNLSVKDLEFHVKLVGWLHIINNTLLLVGAVFVFFFLPTIGLMSGDPDAPVILTIAAVFTSGFMALLGLPGLLAGVGLLRRKNWARYLALIVSLLGLTNFPIGTLLGGYSFFVLLQNTAAEFFAEPRVSFG